MNCCSHSDEVVRRQNLLAALHRAYRTLNLGMNLVRFFGLLNFQTHQKRVTYYQNHLSLGYYRRLLQRKKSQKKLLRFDNLCKFHQNTLSLS